MAIDSASPANTRLERFLKGWVGLLSRRPGWILLLSLLLTLAALTVAGRFSVVREGELFFPSGQTRPAERQTATDRIFGLGFLIGVVEGGTLEQRKRFVEQWVSALEERSRRRVAAGKSGLLRETLYRLPIKFFEDRRLLYLQEKDLLDIEARLKHRLEQERTRGNPFYVDLQAEAEPEIDISFQDLQEKYGVEHFREYSASEDGAYLAVTFKPVPAAPETDSHLMLTLEAHDAAQDIVDSGRFPGVKFSVGGPVAEQVSARLSLERETFISMAIVVVGFSLLVLLLMRKVQLLFILGFAAFGGLMWLKAAAYLLFGPVGSTGALALPISLGYGLAYGLLLTYHYAAARMKDMEQGEALREAIVMEGRATLIGGLTTAMLLVSLAATRLVDLEQFGALAALGVLLMVLAMLGMLPALLILADRFRLLAWDSSVSIINPFPGRIRRGKAILALGAAALLAGAWVLAQSYPCLQRPWCSDIERCCSGKPCCHPYIDFEYDFHRLSILDPVLEETRRKFNQAVPLPFHPVVATAAGRADMAAFLSDLGRATAAPDSPVKQVSSIFTFLPSDQPRKLEIMARIDGMAGEENLKFLDRGVLRRIEETRPLLHPPLITLFQLPLSVIRLFTREPAGAERLLPILEKALSRLPDAIREEERIEALERALVSLSGPEVRAILEGLVHTELADYGEGEAAKWDGRQRSARLLGILKNFHDHYVGTVAYLFPRTDPLFARAALRMTGEIERVAQNHPGIHLAGPPVDLSQTMRRIDPFMWPGVLLGVLALLLPLSLAMRRFTWALAALTPPLVMLMALFAVMALLNIKWNIYSLLALPILTGFVFEAGLRVYFRYWEEGHVGAVKAVYSTALSLALMAAPLMLALFGWLFAEQRGVASLGRITLAGLLLSVIVALTFFPAFLEAIHLRRRE